MPFNWPLKVPPVKGRSSDECPVRLAVIVVAEKFPEPSRLTIAEFVFALVAALANTVAVPTADAVEPPTAATVAATEPEPDAVTSPVNAVIPPPDPLDAAVTRPLAFTVMDALVNEPTLELTVARVVACEPVPDAVTSPVKAVNAGTEPDRSV